MAVYLEVVSSAAGATSSQTLKGSQCLVFFLGGVPRPAPRHPGSMNVLMLDGSVRFAKDLNEIAAQLSSTPISGGMIIIGPASQPGYLTTRWQLTPVSKQLPSLGLTSAGGPVVLIGLLLPAVQAAREAARTKARSAELQRLMNVVGPSGHVFAMADDGGLLPL